MNTGAVTKRYATALLRLTQESGRGEQVCAQVRAMLRDAGSLPSPLEPDLSRFVGLLVQKGRQGYLRRIFRTFVDLYCESAGLRHVILTTAVPSPELEERVRKGLEQRLGCRIMMESEVDPELIGGYRVEVDGKMLDATVRRQLQVLRRDFIEKTNRIV
ncbi:MAG: F0F1 ATP synthase subunit delta [Bacteroidales bacterium]|nr:F0F1 ATP synthase subunit delta [Bacteroidales bacterium]